MNHYNHFTWSELEDRDMDQAAIELGFTQSMWDNGQESTAFSGDWSDLTENQQWAAVKFCYWQDNW
jgi:hypothetical protein